MNTNPSVVVAPAPCATELVFHGLAHLAVGAHHASLEDPAYLRYAREAYGDSCCETLAQDGALLGARMVRHDNVALHALPAALSTTRAIVALARDPDALVEGAHRPSIDQCFDNDREGTEWLLCDLALCARDFEERYRDRVRPAVERACEALAPALIEARSVAPDLARFRVSLSATLGRRGRAFASRWLVAGASGLWSEHGAEHSAVLLLHEHAVTTATHADYLRAEWHAITTLAAAIERSTLRDAHARWVSSLDLRDLAAGAARAGLVDERSARRVIEDRADRAEALRACAARAQTP